MNRPGTDLISARLVIWVVVAVFCGLGVSMWVFLYNKQAARSDRYHPRPVVEFAKSRFTDYLYRKSQPPLRCTVDDSGRTLHSWRSLMLKDDFQSGIDWQAPWNAAHNLKAFDSCENCFAKEWPTESQQCCLFAIVDGNGDPFYSKAFTNDLRPRDFDGWALPTFVYMQLEDQNAFWYEPVDVSFSRRHQPDDLPGRIVVLDELNEDFYWVAFANGIVRQLDSRTLVHWMREIENFCTNGMHGAFPTPDTLTP